MTTYVHQTRANEAVTVAEGQAIIELDLPAHSVTLLEIGLARPAASK